MQWISRLFWSIITQIIFYNVCKVDLTHPEQKHEASLALTNILTMIITALLCKLHFHFHTKTIIFYMITTRQVCVCRARPIFNCAARMCFEQEPRVPQVKLFLALEDTYYQRASPNTLSLNNTFNFSRSRKSLFSNWTIPHQITV